MRSPQRKAVRRTASIAIVALVGSFLAAPALAQEKEKRLPKLGGHNFLISQEVEDPFITTYFRNATGGGVAFDIQSIVLDTDGNTLINTTGDLAFLNLGFEFQNAFADWVAVRIGFEGAARVGTSLEALLGNGVSAVYGYYLGASFRLFETQKVYMSATADFTGNSIYDVGLLRLVQDAIDEGGIPDSSTVLDQGTDKAALGGVRFAWAASRLLGVRAIGRIGIADLFREDQEAKLSFNAEGAVDLNFHNTSNVPLGVLAFFRLANFNPGNSDLLEKFYSGGFELDYTAYEDFGLGLTLRWSRFETVTTRQNVNTFGADINLQFFF